MPSLISCHHDLLPPWASAFIGCQAWMNSFLPAVSPNKTWNISCCINCLFCLVSILFQFFRKKAWQSFSSGYHDIIMYVICILFRYFKCLSKSGFMFRSETENKTRNWTDESEMLQKRWNLRYTIRQVPWAIILPKPKCWVCRAFQRIFLVYRHWEMLTTLARRVKSTHL